MNKLPVGKTIIDAYRFTFEHLGVVIGLIWLPMVLSTLLSFLPVLGGGDSDAGNAVAVGTGAIESFAVLLLTQLLSAVMTVAVTRQALGLRQGPAMIHFALGQAEFRVFGAYLLLVAVAIAGVGTFSLLLALVFGFATAAGGGVGQMAGSVVALAGAAALVYAMIRLGFVLAPATIMENRIDLGRSWALTEGNFWRIVGILLAVFLPMFLLECTAMAALMGHDVLAALPSPGSSNAVIEAHMNQLQEVVRRHMPELLGITLISAPFTLGLNVSAAAFGYRRLAAGATSPAA